MPDQPRLITDESPDTAEDKARRAEDRQRQAHTKDHGHAGGVLAGPAHRVQQQVETHPDPDKQQDDGRHAPQFNHTYEPPPDRTPPPTQSP